MVFSRGPVANLLFLWQQQRWVRSRPSVVCVSPVHAHSGRGNVDCAHECVFHRKGGSVGEVISIHITRERDGVAENVGSATALTNYGLEGDWRSRRNRAGQVTLIEEETLDEVGRLLGYPVSPGASRRQIVMRGVDLNALIGQRIRIGAVRLFVETP